MVLSKFGSLRSRSRPTSVLGSPFRDDTIVAFRYENTVAAEPPIPVGPSSKTFSSSSVPSPALPETESVSVSTTTALSADSSCPPSSSFTTTTSPPPSLPHTPSDLPQPPLRKPRPLSLQPSLVSSLASTSPWPAYPSPSCLSPSSAAPVSPDSPCIQHTQPLPLSRSSSVSACYPPPTGRAASTLRRNPSLLLAAAAAATRNPPPPPPVHDHPLFRDSVPSSPTSTLAFVSVSSVPGLSAQEFDPFSSSPASRPAGLAGISHSNSTRSISTATSRISDHSAVVSESLWQSPSSSIAETCSTSHETVCDLTVKQDTKTRAAATVHRAPSRKRAASKTFVPTFVPASSSSSSSSSSSDSSSPSDTFVPGSALSESHPSFNPVSWVSSPPVSDHQSCVSVPPNEITPILLSPSTPLLALDSFSSPSSSSSMFSSQAHFASLNAATNSIVVDSRLSVDLSCSSPSSSTGTPTASTSIPSAPSSATSSAPVFTRAEYPAPLASHLIHRSDLTGPALSFQTAHESPTSETQSSYKTAPEAPPSDAEYKAPAENHTKSNKSFSIRTMSGVKNRFRSRRRSPTEPSSAREKDSHGSSSRSSAQALSSLASSVGRFSLSATRPSPIAEASDDSSSSPVWSSPVPSSFLGASRLSLLVGGGRGRSGTAPSSNTSALIGENAAGTSSDGGGDDNGGLALQAKDRRGVKKNNNTKRNSVPGSGRSNAGTGAGAGAGLVTRLSRVSEPSCCLTGICSAGSGSSAGSATVAEPVGLAAHAARDGSGNHNKSTHIHGNNNNNGNSNSNSNSNGSRVRSCTCTCTCAGTNSHTSATERATERHSTGEMKCYEPGLVAGPCSSGSARESREPIAVKGTNSGAVDSVSTAFGLGSSIANRTEKGNANGNGSSSPAWAGAQSNFQFQSKQYEQAQSQSHGCPLSSLPPHRQRSQTLAEKEPSHRAVLSQQQQQQSPQQRQQQQQLCSFLSLSSPSPSFSPFVSPSVFVSPAANQCPHHNHNHNPNHSHHNHAHHHSHTSISASVHKPLSSFPFSSSSNSSSLEESFSATPQSLQSRRFSPPTPLYLGQSRTPTVVPVPAPVTTATSTATAPAPATTTASASTGLATAAAAKAQLHSARTLLKQLPLQRPPSHSTSPVSAFAFSSSSASASASASAPRRPFSSAAVSTAIATTPKPTRSTSPGRAAAHHFSLPSSASKNQFGIDFSSLTFSLDDLNIPTEFESRPPPDLRLSVDFTDPYPTSAATVAPATATATAPKTKIKATPALHILSTSTPPVASQSVAKSHFSLTESLWPRPRSQSATVEDYPSDLVIDTKGATPRAKPFAVQRVDKEKDRKSQHEASDKEDKKAPVDESEEPYSPLTAVPIPSESLLDDAFLDSFSFSKRGSVLLGGHRVISRTIIDEYLRSFVASDSDPDHIPDTDASAPVLTSVNSGESATAPTSISGPLNPSQATSLAVADKSSSALLVTPTVEGLPVIFKTAATPSPSLTSLIVAPHPEDPGYEIINALRRHLTTRSLSASTLAAVVAASDKAAQAPDSSIDTQQRRLSDDAQTVVSSAGPRTATPSTLAASDDELDPDHHKIQKATMPSPNDLLHPAVPDLEQESHKVRSLYESGEAIYWEAGRPSSASTNGAAAGPASVSSDRLEPMPEAPEEAENSLVTPVTSHLVPNPTWTTPRSANSSLSQRRDSSQTRREFELAGGLEDWQDVNSGDVDRYGFINPRSSDSRLPSPTEVRQQQMQSRSRRPFSKKDTLGNSLHSHNPIGRPPSRKVSARSLNTQASEVSALSWRSTRSVARQAANMLPANRERRWMDDAGDMLTLAPGISDISDDADAGRITESLKRKEWRRIEKWRHMATVRSVNPGQGKLYEFDMKDPKLIERTWKGIPDCWRAAAWWSFLAQSARETGKSSSEEAIISSFHALQSKPCTDDVQIDLDVPRTISRHIMFRRRYRGGQRLLFRVLHALALYFPEVGYVQGMASLAATLLSYFDEEKAFVMIVRLWTLRGLARLYSPGFEGLMDSLAELEGVWIAGKPVAKKMKELCIPPTAYGTRWYLTLFNLSIPFGAQLRIWDVFMLLGSPAVEGRLPPPPSALTALGSSAAPRRSAINLLPARSKSAGPAAESMAARPATSMGAQTAAQTPSDGLQVLHAASAALIQALGEVLIDSDFENAMKALTSWIPVKDEDLLMRVTMAEYKTHYLHRKKRRLL